MLRCCVVSIRRHRMLWCSLLYLQRNYQNSISLNKIGINKQGSSMSPNRVFQLTLPKTEGTSKCILFICITGCLLKKSQETEKHFPVCFFIFLCFEMHSCIGTNAQLLLEQRRVSRLCNFLSNFFVEWCL